jgi:hypothetical protein
LITKASKQQQGIDRAHDWIAAAEAAIELYPGSAVDGHMTGVLGG